MGDRQRRKMPSFSSSLLDSIYHSIDERQDLQTRNNSTLVEEEIESLRRAIMVEKWIGNYSATPGHLSSNSAGSSTDSSFFSSSESESISASRRGVQKRKQKHSIGHQPEPKREGRLFTRAMKIYGDLKKVKEPNSPGGKIANFLNSIFSPRNVNKKNQVLEEWSSVRKSRSMKDTTTRSCLSKNPSSSAHKSKRSVRFCPVSVIVDGDGHKKIYEDEFISSNIGSQFIKKNINSFRVYDQNENDVDDKSCASSDLFELENIGQVGIGSYQDQELPVYGTTSVKMNRAIAGGLVI